MTDSEDATIRNHEPSTIKSDVSTESTVYNTLDSSSFGDHQAFERALSTSSDDSNATETNNTTASSVSGFARPIPLFENYERPNMHHQPSMLDPFNDLVPTNEIIDYSKHHDVEKVVEVSPNSRYARLNTVLGKGAYKIVYKAIDREEGYEVAWNVLQSTKAEYKELGHEIDILKSVRHPNIITFHDAWYSNSEFIFITELMTSGTLREYIRKLQLPNMKIVKRWSRQILKGLVYLHSHEPPIIHRDIKCDNVFINGAHGEVKIGDMGTAEMKLGKKYTVIGTPEFMAPEMYEEKGYTEKVDIYAFGMCLLEMVTGEYPYSECKNAPQIYKKVTQGIKPDCLNKVTDAEVLELIKNCLSSENERYALFHTHWANNLVKLVLAYIYRPPSAQEILEHSFLAVEPEVVLLATDLSRKQLTLQVVFKGMDRLSVKFEFNVNDDTAEEVVREMIEEQVLPDRYQHLITGEINRILRDMNKDPSSDQNKEEDVWRRESDIKSELDRTKRELRDVSSKASDYEKKLRMAEEKYKDMLESQKIKQGPVASDLYLNHDAHIETVVPSPSPISGVSKLFKSAERMEFSFPPVSPSVATQSLPIPNGGIPIMNLDRESPGPEVGGIPLQRRNSMPLSDLFNYELLESFPMKEYPSDTPIIELVRDAASATNRGMDKANEWVKKLENQDIMTVGDLRDLHDEDWSGIGLTVFALRALKNALTGKRIVSTSGSAASTPGNSSQRSPKISTSTGTHGFVPSEEGLVLP
ncbi:kinase-like domain-containing protein [Endogone sp. FLAS-F59071]|nr:kinase-like domain-containing protein [Endogone sp. FLAS-F59071]|eukprot:RUS14497.1 kinase-like domain-containing protein [Endogone sp. FLAS-F59071]